MGSRKESSTGAKKNKKKKTNGKLDVAKTLKENSSTTATSAAHASLATASRGSCL